MADTEYLIQRVANPADDPEGLPFVLDPARDRYARSALQAYATACEDHYPRVAEDIRALLQELEPADSIAYIQPVAHYDGSPRVIVGGRILDPNDLAAIVLAHFTQLKKDTP
jgi:hypothetical protein